MQTIINQLGDFRSIICLNGELPSAQLLRQFNLPIIAVDGVSKTLNQLGIKPNLIIGDLDSDDPAIFPKVNRIHTPDQDYTDFQKAIHYLDENDLLPGVICGISGGCIDHILHNISIFSQTNSVFMTDSQVGFVLDKKLELNLLINSKISILGCPTAIINSNGLKWELENHKIDIFSFNSLSNRTINKRIQLEVVDGKGLVIIYTEDVIDAGLI